MAVIKYRDSSSKELKKLEIPIPNEVSIGEDETKIGEDVELFIDESLDYEQGYNPTKYSLPFPLGIDENGNYGYYKVGADTLTPFSNMDLSKMEKVLEYDTPVQNGTYAISIGEIFTNYGIKTCIAIYYFLLSNTSISPANANVAVIDKDKSIDCEVNALLSGGYSTAAFAIVSDIKDTSILSCHHNQCNKHAAAKLVLYGIKTKGE